MICDKIGVQIQAAYSHYFRELLVQDCCHCCSKKMNSLETVVCFNLLPKQCLCQATLSGNVSETSVHVTKTVKGLGKHLYVTVICGYMCTND